MRVVDVRFVASESELTNEERHREPNAGETAKGEDVAQLEARIHREARHPAEDRHARENAERFASKQAEQDTEKHRVAHNAREISTASRAATCNGLSLIHI